MVTICRTSALLPHAHLQTIWIIWNLLGNTVCHCLLVSSRLAQRNNKHCKECFSLYRGAAETRSSPSLFVMQVCLIK